MTKETRGRPKQVPKKATTFYISTEVARKFKVFCAEKDISMSLFVEELIVKAMKSKK